MGQRYNVIRFPNPDIQKMKRQEPFLDSKLERIANKEYSDGSNIWQRRSELHRAAGYYSHTEVGFNLVLLKLIALAKTKTHTEVGFHLVLLKLLSSAKHCLDKMKEKWRGKWWWIAMKITFTLAYRYVIFSVLWMLKYDDNRLGQLTIFTHCIFLQTYNI